MPGTFLLHIIYEAMHCPALVVTGEDEGFGGFHVKLPFGDIVFLLAVYLQGHKILYEVEQRVAAQHVFPDVAGAVARLRLYALVLVGPVEGEEACFVAVETGCHEGLFCSHGEVDEATLELEELLALHLSRCHILLDGIMVGLSGKGILQFDGHHGEAVHEDGEVYLVIVLLGVAQLAHDGEAVLAVPLVVFGCFVVCRTVVEQCELGSASSVKFC